MDLLLLHQMPRPHFSTARAWEFDVTSSLRGNGLVPVMILW